MRVGNGFDVHRLVAERPLLLGGVEVPFELGLEGHSDGDVVAHALMDAILGAMGDADIGHHFPPSEERWRDADSIALLEMVAHRMREAGYGLVNADIVIVAERPKLAPYLPQMKVRLGEALSIEQGKLGIKATTTERLGFTGRGEGIAVYAVVLIENIETR